jgi:integrase
MPALSLFDPSDEGRDVRQAITVPQVVDLFIANLVSRVATGDYTPQALGDATRDLLRFAARYPQPLEQCRQHDLTAWLNENTQWKATSTKKRIVSTLLGCFNWALDEELIDRNPYRNPRILRGVPNHIRRPAEAREYIALMQHTTSRPMRQALFVLRRTGMRTCEMRELRWDEVFLDAIVPHICKQKHKNRRRTGKPRLIGLDPATCAFLAAMRRNRMRMGILHPNVFLNCDGKPWDRHTFARHLRRTAERIGLDEGVLERVSGYCFRHTFTVDGLEGGANPKEIADHLGHSDTRMVETVYGSHVKDRLPHMGKIATDISRRRKKLDAPPGDFGPARGGVPDDEGPTPKGA